MPTGGHSQHGIEFEEPLDLTVLRRLVVVCLFGQLLTVFSISDAAYLWARTPTTFSKPSVDIANESATQDGSVFWQTGGVHRWPDRFFDQQLKSLEDTPTSGKARVFSPHQ